MKLWMANDINAGLQTKSNRAWKKCSVEVYNHFFLENKWNVPV